MAAAAILEISNGHISATSRPIHFMFGYMVWFSGTADLMALFSIRINSRWRPPPSWRWRPPPSWIMAISSQQLTIYLYSAHRAVIFAIAQLSCYFYPHFNDVCMSVYKCGLTVVLLKRYLIVLNLCFIAYLSVVCIDMFGSCFRYSFPYFVLRI